MHAFFSYYMDEQSSNKTNNNYNNDNINRPLLKKQKKEYTHIPNESY